MKLMLASVLPMRLPEERDEEMVTRQVLLFSTTVTVGFCGFEVAKASAAAKARVCILYVATRWSLKPESDELNVFLFLFPLGLATTTVVIYYIKVKFRGR